MPRKKKTAELPQYLLINFKVDWADEMDVYGYSIITQDYWNNHKGFAKIFFSRLAKKMKEDQYGRKSGGWTVYVGTNEEVTFDSYDEWINCFDVIEIEYATAMDLLAKLNPGNDYYEFGQFIAPLNADDLSDDEDEEDEPVEIKEPTQEEKEREAFLAYQQYAFGEIERLNKIVYLDKADKSYERYRLDMKIRQIETLRTPQSAELDDLFIAAMRRVLDAPKPVDTKQEAIDLLNSDSPALKEAKAEYSCEDEIAKIKDWAPIDGSTSKGAFQLYEINQKYNALVRKGAYEEFEFNLETNTSTKKKGGLTNCEKQLMAEYKRLMGKE